MTFRLRSKTSRARRNPFETEERRDTLVIVGFVTLIVLLIVGVVAAFALSYYDQNIRPLAQVGGKDISPGLLRDRVNLDQARLTRDEGRYRVLQQTNEIDAAQLSTALDDINTKTQGLTPDSVTEELIDLMYQDQLAGIRRCRSNVGRNRRRRRQGIQYARTTPRLRDCRQAGSHRRQPADCCPTPGRHRQGQPGPR